MIDHCNEAEVHYVLSKVAVGSLIEVSPLKTTSLLVEDALHRGLLCVESKAILIDAFQRVRIQLTKTPSCSLFSMKPMTYSLSILTYFQGGNEV